MSNPTKATRPFYAVRVVLACEDGSTVTRDYVRGPVRLAREAFASYALGDLMRLTGYVINGWTITSISESEVS